MSDTPEPRNDPASPQPLGVKRLARRRVGPAKFALAVLLAVLITAGSFLLVAVLLWAIASLFH